MKAKGTSWGWIIFWLVIFWPIGLFMLFKKLSTDKSAVMSGKKVSLSVIGWILVALGVLGLYGSISDIVGGEGVTGGTIVLLTMAIGGVLLLRKASIAKKTALAYKKYIDIVVNHNVRGIDQIASAIGISYDVAVADLQNMINLGFLKEAYIHQGNREIVLIQNGPIVYQQTPAGGQAAPRLTATRCPDCGANNVVIVGKVAICEYCGNAINA